jgi:pilus assembly protein Flp/PilA
MRFWKKLLAEKDGQDMVEYGLVVALIALALVVALGTFGTNLSTGYNAIGNKVATNVK